MRSGLRKALDIAILHTIDMPPKLIIFAGAPEARSLNWDEDGLLKALEPSIAQFCGLKLTRTVSEMMSASHPSWRLLPLNRLHLSTGFSQSFDAWQLGTEQVSSLPSFFNATQIDHLNYVCPGDESQNCSDGPQSVAQVLSQFYEQSYLIHDDAISSQLTSALAASSKTSFTHSSSAIDSSMLSTTYTPTTAVPVTPLWSNLCDLPGAAYLASITPQTMTVNMIVGIIALKPARAIRTRLGGDVDLVEMLVGDETQGGFGVNFWLASMSTWATAIGDLRGMLHGLRPRDVVLLRNVALGGFRGKVYGQSLRRGLTKVDLLFRNRVHRNDLGGCYRAVDLVDRRCEREGEGNANGQLEKTRRVQEWVMGFVGGAGAADQNSGKGRAVELAPEVLPPDTP